VSSDSRRRLVARTNYQWGFDEGRSWRQGVGVNLTYAPRDNVQISFGPNFSTSSSSAQYVTSVTDAHATETYGRRFVFAAIDQTTLALETRLNLTFTPLVSFELYVQPFLSSGDYGSLKELRAPRTFDFLEYGEDRDIGTIQPSANGRYIVDPDGVGPASSFQVPDLDFNLRSLVGNAVLRWEWRSGSTLFLVWQQRRSYRFTGTGPDGGGDRTPGGFALNHELGELFGIKPENTFLIKVNYWFSR
jgi:hypothetical protein